MNVLLHQGAPRLKPLALAVMLAISSTAAQAAETAQSTRANAQAEQVADDCDDGDTANDPNIKDACTDKDVTDKDVTSDEALSVIGSETTVIQGRELATEDVYLRDISNVHATRENIENYKGTSVGDLFKGLNGVYTGEARNSGALDPNIRGIQGTGRVPVLVDGTEQSSTVWLGPGGVSNRSFVDPNMVGGITAEKGPSFEGPSGIGGTVRIRTLEPGDIIQPGKSWGVELKTETASNTMAASKGAEAWLGRDWRDIEGVYSVSGSLGGLFAIPGTGLTEPVESKKDHRGFNGDDYAWRLAVATEQEHFDFLAAHSFRRTGNYFSGTEGADKYSEDNWLELVEENSKSGAIQNSSEFRNYIGNLFRPGYDVQDTHNEMETILLKGRLELPHDQQLKLSWMQTEQVYGENNHTYIRNVANTPVNFGVQDDGIVRYQLNGIDSTLEQDTLNLMYEWNPSSNPLVDFKAGLWATQSETLRYQSGGQTFTSPSPSDGPYGNYVRCEVWGGDSGYPLGLSQDRCNLYKMLGIYSDTPNPDVDGTIFTLAEQKWQNDRYGFNLSNRFKFSPDFALTLSGDIQHEKVVGDDSYNQIESTFNPYFWGNQVLGVRSGTRREYNAGLHMEWFPTDSVMITGGLKWSRYWSYDDGLEEHRRLQHEGWDSSSTIEYTAMGYSQYIDDEAAAKLAEYNSNYLSLYRDMRDGTLTADQQAYIDEANAFLMEVTGGNIIATPEVREAKKGWLFYNYNPEMVTINGATYLTSASGDLSSQARNDGGGGIVAAVIATPDGDTTDFHKKNPFLNGSMNINETVTLSDGRVVNKYLLQGAYDTATGEKVAYDIPANERGEQVSLLGTVGNSANETVTTRDIRSATGESLDESSIWPKPQKRRNEAWAPMLGITWFMTPHSRVYARYSEFVRFPSVWEDTQAGNSFMTATDNSRLTLEAERTQNIELGYVQDLTPWLDDMMLADVRINYYNNRIENYIDRNYYYQVMQFDEKRTEGIELQARMDTGRYFAGLGATYRLNNELCDAGYAASLDPFYGKAYPACVTAGFPETFTRNSLQPDLSVNLDGGVRLLGNHLELGGRLTYHSSATNEDEEAWIEAGTTSLNRAYNWEPILVYDAYATYKVNRFLQMNAGVNNITDEYYMDPLARTTLPAPGRTFKLGLTAKF